MIVRLGREPPVDADTTPRRRILAHRGMWDDVSQQNSLDALISALSAGFGVETDVRDQHGELVLSHDVPTAQCPSFYSLCEELQEGNITQNSILAINVKSDGLLPLVGQSFPLLRSASVFFFDMSLPQQVQYRDAGMPVAIRLSEYEHDLLRAPDLYGFAPIWLDGFESDWWLTEGREIERLKNRALYVVSPELHRRDPEAVWDWTAKKLAEGWNVNLCTDHPRLVEERLKRC